MKYTAFFLALMIFMAGCSNEDTKSEKHIGDEAQQVQGDKPHIYETLGLSEEDLSSQFDAYVKTYNLEYALPEPQARHNDDLDVMAYTFSEDLRMMTSTNKNEPIYTSFTMSVRGGDATVSKEEIKKWLSVIVNLANPKMTAEDVESTLQGLGIEAEGENIKNIMIEKVIDDRMYVLQGSETNGVVLLITHKDS